MGLIKSAKSAIGSTLHDQWEDYIKCENLDNETLMIRKTTNTGIISEKSAIEVGPGQIAVIVENGKILDATAEEGLYTFDKSSSPSFFAGSFGKVFKEMWTRFKYNGAPNKEQAVFYINAKEIIDNKFGTPSPVPYQDYSHPIPNQMTNTITPLRVNVKCYGKYTFKITDPAIFMREIAGTSEVYKKTQLCEQMRSEVQATFQNLLNELGTEKHQAPALELPSQTDEIKNIMKEKVFDQDIRNRGMEITGFIVESVTLDEESYKKIDNYELSSNSYMQQGALIGGYSDALKNAANNPNGAATGMMGVGMVNMSSNGVVSAATIKPFNNTENSRIDLSKKETTTIKNNNIAKPKFCANCGTPVTGNFCSNCGTKIIQ